MVTFYSKLLDHERVFHGGDSMGAGFTLHVCCGQRLEDRLLLQNDGEKSKQTHVRDYNGQQKDSQGGDHPLMECTMVSV